MLFGCVNFFIQAKLDGYLFSPIVGKIRVKSPIIGKTHEKSTISGSIGEKNLHKVC